MTQISGPHAISTKLYPIDIRFVKFDEHGKNPRIVHSDRWEVPTGGPEPHYIPPVGPNAWTLMRFGNGEATVLDPKGHYWKISVDHDLIQFVFDMPVESE